MDYKQVLTDFRNAKSPKCYGVLKYQCNAQFGYFKKLYVCNMTQTSHLYPIRQHIYTPNKQPYVFGNLKNDVHCPLKALSGINESKSDLIFF